VSVRKPLFSASVYARLLADFGTAGLMLHQKSRDLPAFTLFLNF